MELTILGCYGPYPAAGKACSGYLLQAEKRSLLLDCGNGVLSRLQEVYPFADLDAVILSHLHADHTSDLMIMRYGLQIAYQQGTRPVPLPIYAPASPQGEFERLPYKNAYQVWAIEDSEALEVGPFRITFLAAIHSIEAYSIKIETPGSTLVYSGDTEFNNELIEFARGADLFLCEANYSSEDLERGLENHLSSAQAALIAREAEVKKMILTHHHPERSPDQNLAEALTIFPAALAARERDRFLL